MMKKKGFTPLDKRNRMKKTYLTGFTLMEMLVVIIIIGVLATLSVTHYGSYKERTLDREAQVNLKLIAAAEKIYRMEQTTFYPGTGSQSDIATINADLKLSLPAGSNRNWDYTVWSTGCSSATRPPGQPSPRSWFFTINDSNSVNPGDDGEPNSGAGCP